MKILLTGAAGFIGSHTAHKLLARGYEVVGLDNLNEYYDVTLKQARLARLVALPGFRFEKLDLADDAGMRAFFAREKFPRVIHLAAQAGVRYSLEDPHAYVRSNVTGTLNVLEGCRHHGVEHSGVRLDELRLWRQHQHALLGAQHCRSSAVACTPRASAPMS